MAYFVKAESLALMADYKNAIDQLNYAYRYSKGKPLQLARINARIQQFKQAEKTLDSLK